MPRDVLTEAELDAPIDEVWAVLMDIDSWENWTNIFKFTRARLEEGGSAILWARVGPAATPLPIKFDVIEEESELRWHGGLPGVVYGSHFIKLERIDAQRTRLIHGEEFSGLVISASWPLIGKQLPGIWRVS